MQSDLKKSGQSIDLTFGKWQESTRRSSPWIICLQLSILLLLWPRGEDVINLMSLLVMLSDAEWPQENGHSIERDGITLKRIQSIPLNSSDTGMVDII